MHIAGAHDHAVIAAGSCRIEVSGGHKRTYPVGLPQIGPAAVAAVRHRSRAARITARETEE
jgi:hypothetical protein